MSEENKQEMVEFEFPDEKDSKEKPEVDEVQVAPKEELEVKVKAKSKKEADIDLEIEDDTPPADRGRDPMPKEMVDEIDKDELTDYSEKVKKRLIEMKRIYHDERREKERATREQQEAIAAAQKLLEENKKLRERLSSGEEEYISMAKGSAEMELDAAKRAYKDAYDAGDSDALLEAQQRLTQASLKLERAKSFKPTLQVEENTVNIPQQAQVARPDDKAIAWQQRNTWFGQDEEMTSLALGLHQKLVKSGVDPRSEEYYQRIDNTMRKRFPDYFEDSTDLEVSEVQETQEKRTKPATVVAPATRSTSSKKIRLTTTQVSLAKKLGLTPEQYARELMKMEARNG